MWNEDDLKFYDRVGIERPKHDKHGEDSWEHPISEKLEKFNCKNWRQVGNKLICDTQYGPLTQFMPTNILLTGIDKKGNPLFKKL